MEKIEIIPCLGRKDEWNGDYDCDYLDAPSCEDCIVNFYQCGGKIDPRTGKIHPDYKHKRKPKYEND